MIIAATGFFDGVHRGHCHVIERIKEEAAKRRAESAVITFWPHPRSVLQQDADDLKLLTSADEKRDLLISCGIDKVHVVDFTKDLSRLTSSEFIRDYLKGRFGVDVLVIGYDHHFGRRDVVEPPIEEVAAAFGIECIRVDKCSEDGFVFSSTKIRALLSEGDVSTANCALGYRYGLRGVVVAGKKIGRKIGFPTANIELSDPRKLVPGSGVYFVWVEVMGRTYKGICNIGTRPTVDSSPSRTIETHILDFNDDIYGLDLKMEFVERLRDTVRFPTEDHLRLQLENDRKRAENFLTSPSEIKLR